MEYVLRVLTNSLILIITFLKGYFPKIRRKTINCFLSLTFRLFYSFALIIRLWIQPFNGFFGLF